MNFTSLNHINMYFFLKIVPIFMRANILKSDDDADKLSLNSEIYLFKDYKNKKLKVNLFVQLKTDIKMEEEKAQTSIEEGRLHEIQAAIVRIMKARKVLDHQILMSEVITQVASRFTPSVVLIKVIIITPSFFYWNRFKGLIYINLIYRDALINLLNGSTYEERKVYKIFMNMSLNAPKSRITASAFPIFSIEQVTIYSQNFHVMMMEDVFK